ncbi:maleate cis-trans isomerase [Thermodesulfobacteriota bacterium]
MYGWRARIGVVHPSRGESYIYQFYKIVPDGITLVPTIIGLFNLTKEELSAAYLKYKDAARELAQLSVDTIVFAGSPLFQLKGFGSDLEMIEEVEKETGIPTITSVTAEVEAMRFLKMKKLVVATPFTDEVNKRSASWYQKAGFEVLKIKGMGIEKNSDIALLPFYASYQLAMKTFLETPGADGIYIACPRWGTIDTIEKLEQDSGVPVVTSIQATIWLALKKANVKERIHGYGRLMQG